MPKLTTRQMIIFGATFIAILYGAYSILTPSSIKKVPNVEANQKVTELKGFMDDISANMSKDGYSTKSAYLIARAETEWRRDLFFDKKSYSEWATYKKSPATNEVAQKAVFNYTGYLEVNRKKIAVINGIEYGVGEALETEGYILKNIDPTKVVIFNNRGRTLIEIPLQE